MRKWVLVLLMFLILIALFVLLLFFEVQSYDKSVLLNFEPRCQHFYERCTCFGTLMILESFPEQYTCEGWESCKELDRYEPEGCSSN
jgi:hypothetical protein